MKKAAIVVGTVVMAVFILLIGMQFMPHNGPKLSKEKRPFDLALAKRVVQAIESGRLKSDAPLSGFNPGLIHLPPKFADAAFLENVYVTKRSDGNVIVYFPVEGCRSSNEGYLYNRKPLTGKTIKIYCGAAGMIQLPLTRQVAPHWYYIEGTGCSQT